jgi:hypothetical protein
MNSAYDGVMSMGDEWAEVADSNQCLWHGDFETNGDGRIEATGQSCRCI